MNYYYLDDLFELNQKTSPWAFDVHELQENPEPIMYAGLKAFLVAVLENLAGMSHARAEETTENETAFCSCGLWLLGGCIYCAGKYAGYYIKGVKITRNNVPLVELWNDAEEVKTLRG